MNKIKSAIIALILITAFFIVLTSVSASTLNISPGQSIQTAINNANAGDTIVLASGTYNEYGITINKNITVQGSSSDPSIIDGGGSGRVINVNSGVIATISSVTITNGKTPNCYGTCLTWSWNQQSGYTHSIKLHHKQQCDGKRHT